MRNIWTIARRDIRAYFTSPIAYIVIAGFMVIMGWMFFFNLSHFNLQNLQYQQFNMGKAASITDGIIRPLYGNMNVIFLFPEVLNLSHLLFQFSIGRHFTQAFFICTFARKSAIVAHKYSCVCMRSLF